MSPLRTPPLPAVLVAAALALSGCGAGDAQVSVPSTASGAGAAAAAPTGARAGAYLDYAAYQADPAAHADNRVVLFFHATWCPSCQATDRSLTRAGVPDGLTVVKVDYDTATELRKTHRVTQQHTFVAVDADGNQLAKWSGSVTGEEIKAKAEAVT